LFREEVVKDRASRHICTALPDEERGQALATPLVN
jgi:hypothetical protein